MKGDCCWPGRGRGVQDLVIVRKDPRCFSAGKERKGELPDRKNAAPKKDGRKFFFHWTAELKKKPSVLAGEPGSKVPEIEKKAAKKNGTPPGKANRKKGTRRFRDLRATAVPSREGSDAKKKGRDCEEQVPGIGWD